MNEEKKVQAKGEKPETNEKKASGPALKKADPVKRIIAFIIDAVVSMVVGLIPLIGGIIAPFICFFGTPCLSRPLNSIAWAKGR